MLGGEGVQGLVRDPASLKGRFLDIHSTDIHGTSLDLLQARHCALGRSSEQALPLPYGTRRQKRLKQVTQLDALR